MIRLSHVRDARAATEWLRTNQETLRDAMPLLVMCVTETHDAVRRSIAASGHEGGAFFLDAATATDVDAPRVVPPDLVVLPEAADLCGSLPFLARVQESRQVLHVLWVEDSEEPHCEWLASRVAPEPVLAR